MSTARSNSWLASQNVNGVYIPSALLLVGIAILKADWTPYAAALALLLGSWKVYTNRNPPLSEADEARIFRWVSLCSLAD